MIFLQEAILNLLIWFQVVPEPKLYVSHWAWVPNQSTSLLNMEVVLESSFLLALLCFLMDAKSLGGLQTEAASCLISAQRADDVCMTCCGWPSPVSRLSRCVCVVWRKWVKRKCEQYQEGCAARSVLKQEVHREDRGRGPPGAHPPSALVSEAKCFER